MKIEIVVTEGRMAGKRHELELGSVVLGREPPRDGIALPGDDTVSREHGELVAEDEQVLYKNLSSSGSLVNGEQVMDSVVVSAGDEIRLGDNTLVQVYLESAVAEKVAVPSSGGILSKGPLAKPGIRILLVVYLIGMLFVVVYLALDTDVATAQEWEEAQAAYASYGTEILSEEQRTTRLEAAAVLVRSLRMLETTQRRADARVVCAELMAIDGDPESPIYRFGARCSGSNAP